LVDSSTGEKICKDSMNDGWIGQTCTINTAEWVEYSFDRSKTKKNSYVCVTGSEWKINLPHFYNKQKSHAWM